MEKDLFDQSTVANFKVKGECDYQTNIITFYHFDTTENLRKWDTTKYQNRIFILHSIHEKKANNSHPKDLYIT